MADAFEDVEPVEVRHLDVQEDEVGLELLDRENGLAAVAAFAHDLDLRLLGQEAAQPLAREGLVVHDEGSDRDFSSLSDTRIPNRGFVNRKRRGRSGIPDRAPVLCRLRNGIRSTSPCRPPRRPARPAPPSRFRRGTRYRRAFRCGAPSRCPARKVFGSTMAGCVCTIATASAGTGPFQRARRYPRPSGQACQRTWPPSTARTHAAHSRASPPKPASSHRRYAGGRSVLSRRCVDDACDATGPSPIAISSFG